MTAKTYGDGGITTARPAAIILALLTAIVFGAGGLLLGAFLTALAGVVMFTVIGEITPAASLVLGLVFVQGVGCMGVALSYSTVRRSVGRQIAAAFGIDPDDDDRTPSGDGSAGADDPSTGNRDGSAGWSDERSPARDEGGEWSDGRSRPTDETAGRDETAEHPDSAPASPVDAGTEAQSAGAREHRPQDNSGESDHESTPDEGRFGGTKRRLASDGTFSIPVSTPNLRDLAAILGGYVAAFGGVIAVAGIVTILVNPDTGTNQAAEIGMENPEVLLLLIPASILLIGPGEELLFRGVVQGRLREVFHPYVAVVVAAVFFALLHFFALAGGTLTGNLIALGILTVPSMVFGAVYEYTENILVPAMVHGLYNATLFSLLYVSVAFADQLPQEPQAVLGVLF